MSMQGVISGVLVLSCIFSSNVSAVDVPKKITCSGKIVDDVNRPVPGAKVTLYQLMPDVGGNELKNVTTEEQITKEDGGFSFNAETTSDRQYRFSMLVAAKEGYAIGWDNWLMREDKVMMLAMGKPYTLSGVVVDDAGKPVAAAEVRISMLLLGDPHGGPSGAKYITSAEPLDLLKTTTGDNGVFAFNNIPAEAKAEFVVKKAGRATISTLNFEPPERYNPGQYTVQNKDIRIVQPVEARIEGKVIERDTGKAVGGVKLICVKEKGGRPFDAKPVSKDDGTFSIDGLEAKTYTIRDVPPREKPAEWVIKPATVTTTAGQTSSGIILEASKGGMLEVTIRDNEKKPVAGASVGVRGKDSNQGAGGVSNSEGIAAIRLAPGEYIVQGAYKQGYSYPREQRTVTIEDGKTAKLEFELKGVPKITGVVRDPNGRAIAGASVRISPGGQSIANSDKDGRFEISWNPEQWGNSQKPQPVIVVRHAGRNLAAAVDIDESTKTLDINMMPGIVFTGKVIDPNGKPIAGAKMSVNLRVSNYVTSFDNDAVVTDQEGRYEYKAVPAGQQYTVSTSAEGYGSSYVKVDADDAVNNRLEIGALTLKAAGLSISGIVVDVNDKPVANAEVSVSGQGQQYRRGTTDAQGKFTIDKLCEGQVQVNANVRSIGIGSMPMYGNVSAEAGATDVKVVVAPQPGGEVMPDMGKQPSGTLEVVIVDDANNPVVGANVSVRGKDSTRGQSGVSNENGIASLKLLPGEYEIQRVYKEGYSFAKTQQALTIEVGKTVRVEIELKVVPKITGVVRDPNGQPVARAAIRVFPWGQNVTDSDKEGRFEILWNPERWGGGGQEPEPVLVVRHVRRNLAAAVVIDADTKTLDVNMTQGIVFTGAVVDANGIPIGSAKINVTLTISGHGMSIDTVGVTTDQEGRYEYKAVPAGQQYTVSTSAEGYGSSYVKVDADDAVNSRLEIKPLVLNAANMSISGIVVDVNDTPVANAEVGVSGQGQQHRRGTSNAQGRFIITKLCEGEVQVNAGVRNGPTYLHGDVRAEAGDTDVTVVVAPPNAANQPSVKRAIDSEQFEQIKKTLVTLQQCTNKEELETAIDSAKRAMNEYGEGHVIVGKVMLDGQGDVRDVIAQMEILPDGCFASVTKDLVRPVGFRMHRYAPYDLQLKGMQGELVDVGTIHMTPLREDQAANLKGKVVLEGYGDLSQTILYLRVVNCLINTPQNETYGRNYWPEPIKIQATETGVIEASGFSPINYYCRVEMPGCPEKALGIKFKTGQTFDLGTITLEKPKQIWLSYIVSRKPHFDLNHLKNVAISGGTKWKAVDDESSEWDLEFRQDKGFILMKASYGPCFLQDLGEGEITDYVNVDKTQVGQTSPCNQFAKNGHIYLLDQQSFKHWVLFKIIIE